MDKGQIERRFLAKTEVFIGRNYIGEIVPKLKSAFEEGALFLVYEKDCLCYVNTLSGHLKREGYRVFTREAEELDDGENIAEIPEYVRYVFAVGEVLATRVAKRICADKSINFSLLLCSASSDEIMQGISPKQVFIDTNIIDKSPKGRIASGYGILLSLPMRAFEGTFASKVLNARKDEVKTYEITENIGEVAYELLEVSLAKSWEDSADKMAKILQYDVEKSGKRARLIGEYKFISSCLIACFYSNYLRSPSIDTLPPPERAEEEKERFLIAHSNDGKCVDFFDINSYFRINYILGEYRMDLLEKTANIDVHGMQRFWRRLYGDAGYWLKSELSVKQLLKALSLAGAVSDNLLGYAYADGILNKIG